MKRILIASTFALSLLIASQVSAASITITKLGNNTWKPPYGVSEVYIDACGGGGGGGGGRKVKASGGGAGGSGEWVKNYRLPVSYGHALTIFIPKGGVAGTGGGGDGGDGEDLKITGGIASFPSLNGGGGGPGAGALFPGLGGLGGGRNGVGGLGAGPLAGGIKRDNKTIPRFNDTGGGAGGGNGGGDDPIMPGTPLAASYGFSNGIFKSLGPGSGASAGGGGAPSPFGNGGQGGDTAPATAGGAPTIGYCGGGGGGGPDPMTGPGGAGAQGVITLRWNSGPAL